MRNLIWIKLALIMALLAGPVLGKDVNVPNLAADGTITVITFTDIDVSKERPVVCLHRTKTRARCVWLANTTTNILWSWEDNAITPDTEEDEWAL